MPWKEGVRTARNTSAPSLRQLVKQDLGFLEVARLEAFGEPAIDWRKEVSGLIPLTLVAPEPRHAHGSPQLEGLCLLFPRDRKRILEIRLRFHDIRVRRR